MPASAVRLTTESRKCAWCEGVPGGVPVSRVRCARCSYDGRRSRVTYRRNLLRGYNSIQAKI